MVSFHTIMPTDDPCPICAVTMGDSGVAHDDRHPMCKKCAQIWADTHDTCAFCRTPVNTASLFSCTQRCVRQIKTISQTASQITLRVIKVAGPLLIFSGIALAFILGPPAVGIASGIKYGSIVNDTIHPYLAQYLQAIGGMSGGAVGGAIGGALAGAVTEGVVRGLAGYGIIQRQFTGTENWEEIGEHIGKISGAALGAILGWTNYFSRW